MNITLEKIEKMLDELETGRSIALSGYHIRKCFGGYDQFFTYCEDNEINYNSEFLKCGLVHIWKRR